jgi:hypothetical protein
VTEFVNLKIKSAQSFRCTHRDMICVHIFIRVSNHTYINIYIYTMFLKKRLISPLSDCQLLTNSLYYSSAYIQLCDASKTWSKLTTNQLIVTIWARQPVNNFNRISKGLLLYTSFKFRFKLLSSLIFYYA